MAAAQWPVRVDPVFFCWLWQDGLTPHGYGSYNGKGIAHRRVYSSEAGAIDKGLMLDHLCRRRSCVNPMHLEPVTQSINEQRKSWAHRCKIKLCQHGHDLYEFGRRTPEGGKICIECK